MICAERSADDSIAPMAAPTNRSAGQRGFRPVLVTFGADTNARDLVIFRGRMTMSPGIHAEVPELARIVRTQAGVGPGIASSSSVLTSARDLQWERSPTSSHPPPAVPLSRHHFPLTVTFQRGSPMRSSLVPLRRIRPLRIKTTRRRGTDRPGLPRRRMRLGCCGPLLSIPPAKLRCPPDRDASLAPAAVSSCRYQTRRSGHYCLRPRMPGEQSLMRT